MSDLDIKKDLIEVEAQVKDELSSGEGRLCFEDGKRKRRIDLPATLLGETYKLLLKPRRRGRFFIEEMTCIEPSKYRVESKCPHFTQCGGCRFQHLPYKNQAQRKEDQVAEAFEGFFKQGDFKPILTLEEPWQARGKMEYSFSEDSEKNRYLGLYGWQAKRRVQNIESCPVSPTWFEIALNATRKWWGETKLPAYRPRSNTGLLQTLTLRHCFMTPYRMVILTISGDEKGLLEKAHIETFTQQIKLELAKVGIEEEYVSIFLMIKQTQKGKPTQWYEWHLGGPDHMIETLHLDVRGKKENLDFKVSPSTFFQANAKQAQQFISLILEQLDLKGDEVVWDLCCGSGVLGLSFAKYVEEIYGLELNPHGIFDARENAKKNKIDNATFEVLDLNDEEAFGNWVKTNRPPNILIVDPPRSGLGKGINQIEKVRPEVLVYISCNIKTQKIEVEHLLKDYEIDWIQPVDQFPHTPHIENLIILKRKS